MLASNGDLYGARDALMRFDEIANPERSIGRFALVRRAGADRRQDHGPDKGASWIGLLAQGEHSSTGRDGPSGRSPGPHDDGARRGGGAQGSFARCSANRIRPRAPGDDARATAGLRAQRADADGRGGSPSASAASDGRAARRIRPQETPVSEAIGSPLDIRPGPRAGALGVRAAPRHRVRAAVRRRAVLAKQFLVSGSVPDPIPTRSGCR